MARLVPCPAGPGRAIGLLHDVFGLVPVSHHPIGHAIQGRAMIGDQDDQKQPVSVPLLHSSPMGAHNLRGAFPAHGSLQFAPAARIIAVEETDEIRRRWAENARELANSDMSPFAWFQSNAVRAFCTSDCEFSCEVTARRNDLLAARHALGNRDRSSPECVAAMQRFSRELPAISPDAGDRAGNGALQNSGRCGSRFGRGASPGARSRPAVTFRPRGVRITSPLRNRNGSISSTSVSMARFMRVGHGLDAHRSAVEDPARSSPGICGPDRRAPGGRCPACRAPRGPARA